MFHSKAQKQDSRFTVLLLILMLLAVALLISGCEQKPAPSSGEETSWPPLETRQVVAEQRLYVTAMHEDKVSVIDLATAKVVSEQRVGSKPYGLAIDRTHNQLLVVCALAHELWFLDLDSLEILATLPVGRVPAMVTVDESSGKAYVSNTRGDGITVVDTQTHQAVGHLVTGKAPYNIELLQNGHLAVLNHDDALLVVIDPTDGEIVQRFAAMPKSAGMALHPSRNLLFSGGHGSADNADEIHIHDLNLGINTGTIPTGQMAAYMSVADPYLHVVLHDKEELISFDLETYQEVIRMPTGKYPFAVVPVGSSTLVAVSNMDSENVQIFDIELRAVRHTIDVQGGPVGLAYHTP